MLVPYDYYWKATLKKLIQLARLFVQRSLIAFKPAIYILDEYI